MIVPDPSPIAWVGGATGILALVLPFLGRLRELGRQSQTDFVTALRAELEAKRAECIEQAKALDAMEAERTAMRLAHDRQVSDLIAAQSAERIAARQEGHALKNRIAELEAKMIVGGAE